MLEGGVSLSSRLTVGWSPLGADTNFRKVDLYHMQWTAQVPVHLSDFSVAAGSFGGPIALLRNDKRVKQGTGELIHIFSSSGHSIKTVQWKGGPLTGMGWSSNEDLVCVQQDGMVHVFPLDPHLTRSKHSFSMGKEAKETGLIDCKVFNTLYNNSTGVAVLTGSYRFIVVKNIQDPRTNELSDLGLDSPPSCWQVVSNKDGIRLLVAKEKQIYILAVNERSVKQVRPQFNTEVQAIIEMAVSFDHQLIALFADTGAIWMGVSDLSMKQCEYDTGNKSRPKQLVWCGSQAVAAHWNKLLMLVGFENSDIRYSFDEPMHVIEEPDGCRIVTNSKHQLFQKVPNVVNDVCKLGSVSPGRLLLEASEYYRKGSHSADDYLALIKEQNNLDLAVQQCIDSAGREFDLILQKALLKAASFGKVFQNDQKDPDYYVNMCKKLRVMNAIRSPEVGIPLTYQQFALLKVDVLIDRLILRQHWPQAQQISNYLKLSLENKILVHWACFKVEQRHLGTDAVAHAIGNRLKNVPAIQYSDIANRAADEGRKELAVLLLNFEPRAAEQVPLLLKLAKPEDALAKAIDSGDADLVYKAIFYMKEHAQGSFNLKLRKFPVALNYYQKLCREHDQANLEKLVDQEDDHVSMARIKADEAKTSANKEQKIVSLLNAAEQYRRVPDEFSAKQTELQVKLLRYQQKLEQKLPTISLFDLSVNDTLTELMKLNESRQAEDLKKEFMVPERRYMWIRAQVLARLGHWDELEKLSKVKRVPLIGFEGFAELALRHYNKMEALKYILKLKDESKVKYILRYTEGNVLDAARLAFEQKDQECLQLLRERAAEKASTSAVAQDIDSFINQLRRK